MADVSWYLLSGGIAFAVGAGEIISRYRDEPFLALTTLPSFFYILLNGSVGVFAFWLAITYDFDIEMVSGAETDMFMTALATGLGGMVILRSKLFELKGKNDTSHSIGPSLIVDGFLEVLDRAIDRKRAVARQKAIVNALNGITDYEELANFLEASLLSMQSLKTEEKAALTAIVEQYRSQEDWPVPLRNYAIGFLYQSILGEKGFSESLKNLRRLEQDDTANNASTK